MRVQPVAVLISDVHYSLQTLRLADAAMRQAIAEANQLEVPLIVAGDLHDTKANMRAECINAMIETFRTDERTSQTYILRGNHDQINEKSTEHALNFLRGDAFIVDEAGLFNLASHRLAMIPYHHDLDKLRSYLENLPPKSVIIMHQGVQGSDSGEYIMDPTAIPQEWVKDFRVISGHYHRRQTIKCRMLPRCVGGSFSALREEHLLHQQMIGTWDYIGNPYTLNYGEADHPPKGFHILYSDGNLEFIPTNLRKHIIYETRYEDLGVLSPPKAAPDDLVLVRITGESEDLQTLNKQDVGGILGYQGLDIRLDLVPDEIKTDSNILVRETPEATLDSLIDILETNPEVKHRLKILWKELVT